MDVCGSGNNTSDIRGYFYTPAVTSTSNTDDDDVQWSVLPQNIHLIVDEQSQTINKKEENMSTEDHPDVRDADKPDVKRSRLAEGEQAEVTETKPKYIPLPPGTLREQGNGNYKLTLSSYKNLCLSMFNKSVYAHIWNNAASKCMTLSMDEMNTLLENREKIFAIFSILQSRANLIDPK